MITSILIDATHIGTNQPTGVERYVDALLPVLSEKLMAAGVDVTWVSHYDEPAHPAGVKWIRSEHVHGWGQFAVRQLMLDGKFDLYFTPSSIVPLGGLFQRSMTMHDLSFMRFPKAYSPSQRIRLGWWAPRAAVLSRTIIVPSEFVKNDLIRFWKVPTNKIEVAYHGPIPLSEKAVTVEGVNPEKPFIVYMGRLEEKKGLTPLILAFVELAKKNPDLQLVLAGKAGVGEDIVRRTVREMDSATNNRIILPGYVSNEQQRWLYDHARVVAVPSPAEGFGFGVLEGFESSVPVVCSTEGAAPEIGGDAVLKASNLPSWIGLLNQALEDEPTRSRLIAEGKKRLTQFSWDKSAQETAEALIRD
ncbi:MAG TPA: glycosyltransferase family 1 protein [Verrucomicrobiae bacterium]|nr:glycosyltransferase family 1 protein [Verrucomicrobiae bacterium]